MEFDISFTGKEITPWGGMAFMKQFLDKIGFREQIEKCSYLPTQGSNWGHLLESGTDLRYIQEIFGHKSSKTTEIYTHVSTQSLQKIKSPFDDL